MLRDGHGSVFRDEKCLSSIQHLSCHRSRLLCRVSQASNQHGYTCMQHYRNKNSPGNGAGSRATPDHLLRWDRQGQPGTGVSTPVIRKVTHGVGSDCSNLRLRGGVRSRWWGRTPLAFHSARERRRDHAFSRICTCHRDTRHITSLKTLSAVITLATAECRRRKCSYHEFCHRYLQRCSTNSSY